MTCDTLLAQISAYLDGDLGAASCESLERHAAGCPACAKIIEEFRTATGLCRTAADAPLPDGVRQLAQERVRTLLRRS
jgi:anti-sigma factor RsiW